MRNAIFNYALAAVVAACLAAAVVVPVYHAVENVFAGVAAALPH